MWRMIHKETGKVILVNDTTKGFYQSRAAVVRAVKTSGVLRDLGLTWSQIDLVDHWGRTMAERSSVAVVEGQYALRHREGWYWVNPGSGKVWYHTTQVLDTVWNTSEIWLRQMEDRARYTDLGKAGFQLVQGLPNGEVKVYPCRY